VVGAGAAGLLAAVFAARAGTRVLVLETRPKPGAKIRVSGGGRCNVLPSAVTLDDFHTSGSRNTLRNLLFSWPLPEVHAFFERDLGIPLKTEPTGKVFPVSDESKEVVDALLAECARSGAELLTAFRVTDVLPAPAGSRPAFLLRSDTGETLRARRLVLATGGLSLPKTGSDGGGLAIARRLGHSAVPTYPALVPLLAAENSWSDLAGLSAPVRLTAERAGKTLEQREGDLLFTHRGFSGPVVLDLSHHVTHPGSDDVRLLVHWSGSDVPDWDAPLREGGRATVASTLRRHLPRRLVLRLAERAAVAPETALSTLPREARARLVETLARFPLPIAGSEGYRTAEVTGGGIPLEEVATATLESRIVPGLHFCGEILDVTGRLGGYNFLWAWTSGRRAGQAAAAALAPAAAA